MKPEAIQIPNPAGELEWYVMFGYPKQREYWLVKVVRDDDPVSYCVTKTRGKWYCDCGDYIWRQDPINGMCKHAKAVLEAIHEQQSAYA